MPISITILTKVVLLRGASKIGYQTSRVPAKERARERISRVFMARIAQSLIALTRTRGIPNPVTGKDGRRALSIRISRRAVTGVPHSSPTAGTVRSINIEVRADGPSLTHRNRRMQADMSALSRQRATKQKAISQSEMCRRGEADLLVTASARTRPLRFQTRQSKKVPRPWRLLRQISFHPTRPFRLVPIFLRIPFPNGRPFRQT